MTKALEIPYGLQIEINRRLWIDTLRQKGNHQCLGWGCDPQYCALHLAFKLADGNDPSNHATYAWLGTTRDSGGRKIWWDNDEGWTFKQIADAAEQGRYWPVEAQSVG